MPGKFYMPQTEFDDLLRERFEQGSFEYQPAAWERLSTRLPVKKKSLLKRALWIPLAAAAALIIGVFVVPSRYHLESVPSVVLATLPHSPVEAPVQGEQSIIPIPKAAKPVPTVSNTSIARPLLMAKNNNLQPTSFSYTDPTVPSYPEVLPGTAEVSELIESTNAAPIPLTELAKISVAPENDKNNPKPTKKATIVMVDGIILPERSSTYFAGREMQFDEPRKPFGASSIAIAGGYKYGTANMGYMVGINGRKSLGAKVFVEGDVAFANSRNAQVTTQTPTDRFDQVKTVAGKNSIGARALSRGEVIANMYYLQVTPTVGYQVLPSMALGAGADLQRMLRNDENTLYVMDGSNVQPIPHMDYGVVGKAEYSLTKALKAGVQYRQGVNTLIAPDKNYLNRSYLQVQLKLNIIGR